MTIHKIGTGDVIKVTKFTPLLEAAKLMRKKNIGNIVVVENEYENKPIGMLTDRDIAMKVVAEDLNVRDLSVGDVMSADVLVLKKHQAVNDALDMMAAKGVRRAPIVEEDETVCGIATIDDLLILLADELNSLAKLVRKQIEA